MNTGGASPLNAVGRGAIVEGGDFSVKETRAGSLSFNAIVFGARLRISTITQEHLALGDQRETDLRALIHLGAAMEWAIQKRPIRIRTRDRVDDFANDMRDVEIGNARGRYRRIADRRLLWGF